MDAITLDLDDTLWPVDPAIERAEAALMNWFAERAPGVLARLDLAGLRRIRAEADREAPELAHDLTELRLRSIRTALRLGGEPESLAQDGLDAFMAARNTVELYPDALPALEALAARYRLGAVSNGNADLEAVGLAPLFAFHVTARAAGCAKPARGIFEQAIQAAGAAPQRIAHVGDDLERDVAGARAAGLRTVWVDRAGSGELGGADAVIGDLSELLPLLEAGALTG